MSSGQSLRNGSSVEPGLPNTFLMPNARRRPKVASLTVVDLLSVLVSLRDKGRDLSSSLRAKRSNPFFRCSGMDCFVASLLAMTGYHSAVPFMVGCPCEFAVHNSMPLAL